MTYLTTGPSRKLRLGRAEVTLQHVSPRVLALKGSAGAAVRALKWLGPNHVEESVAKLHRTLPSSDWEILSSHRATMPSWMAAAVGRRTLRWLSTSSR